MKTGLGIFFNRFFPKHLSILDVTQFHHDTPFPNRFSGLSGCPVCPAARLAAARTRRRVPPSPICDLGGATHRGAVQYRWIGSLVYSDQVQPITPSFAHTQIGKQLEVKLIFDILASGMSFKFNGIKLAYSLNGRQIPAQPKWSRAFDK